jgi:hypothetical protein
MAVCLFTRPHVTSKAIHPVYVKQRANVLQTKICFLSAIPPVFKGATHMDEKEPPKPGQSKEGKLKSNDVYGQQVS